MDILLTRRAFLIAFVTIYNGIERKIAICKYSVLSVLFINVVNVFNAMLYDFYIVA
jgi:hypothetical protein